ncbi:hypothetical protein [Pseudomonas sp. FH1]|uniref:hypothetical protein n=1 Tax=Pseudomonas sp. FH1 TaxID=1284392 RepID=UPI0003DBAE03|nr:hypothetical protein [Pseudomonas sp. FH1]ETK22142.1 hypothetical protein H096_17223 [Pseudomonas sp. FH1]
MNQDLADGHIVTSKIDDNRLVDEDTIDQNTDWFRKPSMFNMGTKVAFQVAAITIAKIANMVISASCGACEFTATNDTAEPMQAEIITNSRNDLSLGIRVLSSHQA